jgi:hypothetical protein
MTQTTSARPSYNLHRGRASGQIEGASVIARKGFRCEASVCGGCLTSAPAGEQQTRRASADDIRSLTFVKGERRAAPREKRVALKRSPRRSPGG